jgi:hypothetical protein
MEDSMKKTITRIMLLALSAVLTLSLILGLGGCAASGPDAYVAAETSWKEATTKSVTDDITVTTAMDLGATIGNNVVLTVNFTLDRKYKSKNAIDEFAIKVKKIELSGINSTFSTVLSGILSGMGISLPSDVLDLLGEGTILMNNPAEGKIEAVGEDYVLSGEVNIDLVDFSANTDDLEEPIIVSKEAVEDAMDDLGLSIPFDLLHMYEVKASKISKNNEVSFTGKEGLRFIFDQVYELVDNLFAGEIIFNGEEVVVPEAVEDIVEGVAGGTDSDDIDEYLFGDDGLIDLGNVNLEISYAKKKFDKIKGTHTMGFSITQEEVSRIIDIDAIYTPLAAILAGIEGLSLTPETIVDTVFGLVPLTIEADITISFTSSYSY